jgi:stage V sporulation protein B
MMLLGVMPSEVVLGLNRQNRKTNVGARSFMSGVLLLSLSTVIVKIIGLAFKIPMLSLLGTEGMGYFNSAYEIYALLCVIATAGLPVALSMLVSSSRARGEGDKINRIYRTALTLFAVLGALGSVGMIVFSRKLSEMIGNADAYLCILGIAPALLLVCISSAIRGYCQGFEYMTPTAVSQLIEAVGKLVFGMLFAYIAIEQGFSLPAVAAFAVMGISLGALISLVYLVIAKTSGKFGRDLFLCDEYKETKDRRVLRELVAISLPITLGSAVIGLTRIIDMTQIMRGLQSIGISEQESNSIYGAYTTLALPIFSLIPSLITPISMTLVPQLSASLARRDRAGEKIVLENSMRYTVLLAMPAALGVTLFAEPILNMLFSNQREAIAICTPLLSALGGSVLFSCVITTTNALLQSYRCEKLPIISMSVGVIVKFISSYMLIRIPEINVMGAPIGSLLCNVTICVINLYCLERYANVRVSASAVFFKPLLASAFAVGGGYAIFLLLAQRWADGTSRFLLSVAATVLLYAVMCILSGCVTREDIRILPFGERICAVFDRKNKKQQI